MGDSASDNEFIFISSGRDEEESGFCLIEHTDTAEDICHSSKKRHVARMFNYLMGWYQQTKGEEVDMVNVDTTEEAEEVEDADTKLIEDTKEETDIELDKSGKLKISTDPDELFLEQADEALSANPTFPTYKTVLLKRRRHSSLDLTNQDVDRNSKRTLSLFKMASRHAVYLKREGIKAF